MNRIQEELTQLLEILEIEKQTDKEQYLDFLSKSNLHQQKKAGLCWHPLNIKDSGYGLGDYPFLVVERTKLKGEPHQLSAGKQASLFLYNNNQIVEELQGTINYVNEDSLKISLYGDDLPSWVHNGSIGINLQFDEKSYQEMERGVKQFLKAKDPETIRLAETILGYRDPLPEKDAPFCHEDHLNESQNQALKACLQSQDVAIIHGPPGTGKTTTITEVIRYLVKQGEKILVCAPSNTATDLLTDKLDEKRVKVTRIGNLSRIDEKIITHTLEYGINNHPRAKEIKKVKKEAAELRRMASQYKRNFGRDEREQRKLLYREAKALAHEGISLENYIIEDILEQSDVIATTLVGSTNRYLEGLIFDTVIIDEAAQALEPATWIPIQKAKKVILAGDPFQLPPTIKSQEAAKLGLDNTLIEKAIQRIDRVYLLKEQYRMNEAIMAFSNQQFYADQLIANEKVKSTQLKDKYTETSPIQFIDTAGCGFEEKQHEENRSYHNPEEAALLLKHLLLLIPDSILPINEKVGIISPYKAQTIHLDELISDEEKINRSICINTVDAFQGQEKDIIYISLVRSNENAEIGFLKDYRRMNVAMTRAKKKLVIIGDSATLANDAFYADFIAFVEKNNAYKSAYEYLY